MADPAFSAQVRADALLKLETFCPELAGALGVDPPEALPAVVLKEPHLREARMLESLAAFVERATGAAKRAKPGDGYVDPVRLAKKKT